MSRLDCRLAALLLIQAAAIPCARSTAQVPIEPLLTSHEPRLIALGAYEVIKREDDTQIPRLIEMTEHWDPAERKRRENGDRYDAMTVILDALIERQAAVSPAAVVAIQEAFPDQALILASRMHPEDAEPILLRWFQEGRAPERAPEGDEAGRQLRERVAAMLLAKSHPEEIAARVLGDSLEVLAVSVPDWESPGQERCMVDCWVPPNCRSEIGEEGQTGWPPVFRYVLEENDPDAGWQGGYLVEAGGDRITYRREQAEIPPHHCLSPRPLTATTRHHLLAEMLHVGDQEIPWGPQMNATVPWRDDGQFLRDLGEVIDVERQRLQGTMKLFYSKQLLTRSQFETSRPRLAVVLMDDRRRAEPAHSALPLVEAPDARTTCRLGQ